MAYDAFTSQPIELTQELPRDLGVCFDPDRVVLQGVYPDEISAHRAKRLWSQTLSSHFLLDAENDFRLQVNGSTETGKFVLTCSFLTACGRYAFWRITNNQAPETQYVIETAHIPICSSRHEDILCAPDLHSIHEEPLILSTGELTDLLFPPRKPKFSSWLKKLLGRKG